jgi:hypothetical protein
VQKLWRSGAFNLVQLQLTTSFSIVMNIGQQFLVVPYLEIDAVWRQKGKPCVCVSVLNSCSVTEHDTMVAAVTKTILLEAYERKRICLNFRAVPGTSGWGLSHCLLTVKYSF